MEESRTHGIEYVQVHADFMEDGVFCPRSLKWELEDESQGEKAWRTYVIDQVLESGYLPCEDYEKLFPPQSPLSKSLIYQYRVRISGEETSLYFARTPETAPHMLGRWFVVRKKREEK